MIKKPLPKQSKRSPIQSLPLQRLLLWFTANRNRTYVLLLIIVAVVSHIAWFMPGAILFHSDWLHWPDINTAQAWSQEGTWKNFMNFGGPNIQMGYFLVTFFWPLIAHLGGGFDAAVKLTVMIPIAFLGFLAPYVAMRKLIADDFVAFVAALFFGSTTYFLVHQGAHLPIVFVYALSPIIFTFFVTALETMAVKDWVLFALTYTVGLCYEVRIMYIFTFVLCLYAFLFFPKLSSKTKLFKPLLVIGVTLVGLNCFWFIPTLFGGTESAITQATSTGLFGSQLFDLPHALTLSDSSWTGSRSNEDFVMQPIKPYLWLVPLTVLVPLVISSRMSLIRRRQVAFFAVLALVGIFLTKQELNPLPEAYPWLYAHFPGFSLFREASKFYLLTAWGYMGLLALGLTGLRTGYPKAFRIIVVLPIVVACLNLWPLVTGKIGTLFVARHLPRNYALLNDKTAKNPTMVRTLWVPSDSKWAYFDPTHPKAALGSTLQQDWNFLLPTDYSPIQQHFLTFFHAPYAKNFLDIASVHFVVVPLRDTANEDDFFRYFGNDRQFYVDLLDHTPWLTRVNIGTKDVAVYENRGYKPYINSATNVYAIDNTFDLQQLYALDGQTLKQGFDFAFTDKQQAYSSNIQNIFEHPETLRVNKGQLTTQTTVSRDATLYTNINHPTINYTVTNRNLAIYTTQHNDLSINGKPASNNRDLTQKIGSLSLATNRDYYMVSGTNTIPINNQTEQRNLGVISNPIRVVSDNQTNLIANPSLEAGLWQTMVRDCNAYDQNADIHMGLTTTEHTDGKQALALYTTNHTACTGPNPIAVKAGSEYILSFDYRVENGDEAGYVVTFNDPNHTSIKRYPVVNNESWHTIRQLIAAPTGATTVTIQLSGIPNTHTGNYSITNYDNLRLSQVTTVINPNLNLAPDYQAATIEKGSYTFSYQDNAYSGANLISDPSFEQGLWRSKVDDCNAYDNKAQISMTTSTQASDGKKSLELAAKRHIACTGPPAIPVKENTTYLLSFDHQSPNAKQANYYLSFDNPDKTALSDSVPTSNQWQHFARIITTPTGTQHMQLSVRAMANEAQGSYTINRYDNFKLIEIPNVQSQYYLVDQPNQRLTAPQKIQFTSVNSNKKLVTVQHATTPFYLTMNDAYHDHWRLELNNSKVGWSPWAKPDAIAASDHIKWDNFMNGWYVDPTELCADNKAGCERRADGSYDMRMVVEFTSQRWFYLGGLITGVSISVAIVYLSYAFVAGQNAKIRRR